MSHSLNNMQKYPRSVFDFEIGYLIKSPCRACGFRDRLPQCADGCPTLNQVQSLLAPGVSCSRSFPAGEAYIVSTETRQDK